MDDLSPGLRRAVHVGFSCLSKEVVFGLPIVPYAPAGLIGRREVLATGFGVGLFPGTLSRVLLPTRGDHEVDLVVGGGVPCALSCPVCGDGDLAYPTRLVRTLDPPGGGFDVATRCGVFKVSPADHAFVVLYCVFPPGVVGFEVYVYASIVELSDVRGMQPAGNPNVVSRAYLVPIMDQMEDCGQLRRTQVAVFVYLTCSHLIPLVRVFTRVNAVEGRVVVGDLVVEDYFDYSPFSFAKLGSIARGRDGPFLKDRQVPSKAVFFPVGFKTVHALMRFRGDEVQGVVIPDEAAHAAVAVVSSSQISRPAYLGALC